MHVLSKQVTNAFGFAVLLHIAAQNLNTAAHTALLAVASVAIFLNLKLIFAV